MTADVVAAALDLEPLWHLHWDVQGCSATSGEGLHDALEWVVDAIETHDREPDRVYNVPYSSWSAELHVQGRFPGFFCRQVVVILLSIRTAHEAGQKQHIVPTKFGMVLVEALASYGPSPAAPAAFPNRPLVLTPTSNSSFGCAKQVKAGCAIA